MDGMFVWILLFSCAAIGLLAVFLVASEKELKKKRAEIDQLLVKLGDGPATEDAAAPATTNIGYDSQEIQQLRAKNRQLEQELAAASSRVESALGANEELELAQRNVEIAKSNAQWLQTSNEELKAQVEELMSRLAASAAGSADFAGTSPDQRQQVLEREVIELRKQLAEARSPVGAGDGAAVENSYRENKGQLEGQIVELQKELSSLRAAKSDEASVREQLAESERIQQVMRDERRGLEQEINRLRASAQEVEEQSRQIAALQEPFVKMLAKHSALEEQQREYREALADFSNLIANSNDWSPRGATFNEFNAANPAGDPRPARFGNGNHEANAGAVTAEQMVAAAQLQQKPKRRFGLFPVVIALIFGGSLAAVFWGMQDSHTTPTANALPVVTPEKAPTPPTEIPESASSEAPAAPEAPLAKAPTPAVKEKPQPVAKSIEVAKVPQSSTGTYEIIQSSRVFAAPSEHSEQMGDIDPGVRVNVVNSKNGWLEIHSKHGRPPGFIRKESARMLARN